MQRQINVTKKSYIFLQNNGYKTPYIDIYIDLQSINFNLLPVLLHYAYHQISHKFYRLLQINLYCTTNNMIAKYIVLSNIIRVVSVIFSVMYPGTSLDIKKVHSSSSYLIGI